MTHTTIQHAVILLAGFGSRLRPLTDTAHKALIQVGTQTILERQVFQLVNQGIRHLHLIVGNRADDIKHFVHNRFGNRNLSFHFHTNEIYNQTNTGFSLWVALHHVTHDFILLDGDLVLGHELLHALLNQKSCSSLLCDTTQTLDEEAVKISMNTNNVITGIGKHIPIAEAQGESIGAAFLKTDWLVPLKDALTCILKGNKECYYEDAFNHMVRNNLAPTPIKMVSTGSQPWVEVDDHADLERAKQMPL